MKKFNYLFRVGLMIFVSPIIIFILMFFFQSNSYSEPEIKEEIIKVYDTVKIKKIEKVFDTIKVEKIKWIEKEKIDTLTVN